MDYDPADARDFVSSGIALRRAGELFALELEIPALGMPIQSWFAFSGEPHLVLVETRQSESGLGVAADRVSLAGGASTFLKTVGDYVNRDDRSLFPLGINVNLARVEPRGRFAYRTYERGLFRETLACGTGAVAVAAVADQLFGPGERRWVACPQGALLHPAFKEHAQITVKGKSLSCQPRLVFKGSTKIENSGSISTFY